MSKENHPNFHSCKFVTDIVTSFYESIRNEKLTKEDIAKIGEECQEEILAFVYKIESKVDDIANTKPIEIEFSYTSENPKLKQ